MVLLTGGQQSAESVEVLVKKGWTVISDGPSGTQLAGPKKMRSLDVICAIAGVVCVLAVNWILGVVLMAIACLDYALFTKPPTKFISR